MAGAAFDATVGTGGQTPAGDNVAHKCTDDGTGVVNDAIAVSTYSANKTAASASQTRDAIPAGSQVVEITNMGPTNFAMAKIGDSAVAATVTTGAVILVNQSRKLAVPNDATHISYIADTADVTLNMVWQ